MSEPAGAGERVGLEAPAGNPRFGLVDGLRCIAVLAVIANHVDRRVRAPGVPGDLLSHGNCGVAIFFVISGFLLYRPFVASRHGAPRLSTTGFYWRRILRIVPAYWFAVTVLAIYPGLPMFASRWWQIYGFAQIYDPKTVYIGIQAAWSLDVEISFYLLLPLYAFLVSRAYKRIGPRGEVALLVLMAVASLGAHEFTSRLGGINTNFGFTLPATFYLFAVGMVIAVVSVAFPAVSETLARHSRWFWPAGLALYVGVSVTTDYASLGSVHPVYGILAALVVAPAIFRGDPVAERVLSLRAVGWIGLVSYAVYLWHQPIIDQWHPATGNVVALLALTIATSCAVAAFSYYVIELPFLRLKRRSARRGGPVSAAGPGPLGAPGS